MNVNLGMVLTIFLINVVYVTLNTLRVMMTMKGYRLSASALSVFEVILYVVALGLVMENLTNVWNILAYAIGFGTGIYIGIYIEDILALGYTIVEVILPDDNGWQVAEQLRVNGYGVTITQGFGRDGSRYILEILTPRSNERVLYRLISDLDPKAFIISHEPKFVNGGFWTKRLKKDRLKKQNERAAS